MSYSVHDETLPLLHDQLHMVLVQGVQNGLHYNNPGFRWYIVVLLLEGLAESRHGDAIIVLESLLLVYPLQQVEPVLYEDHDLLLGILHYGYKDAKEGRGYDYDFIEHGYGHLF